jgi:YVTN family beta-propeller protein
MLTSAQYTETIPFELERFSLQQLPRSSKILACGLCIVLTVMTMSGLRPALSNKVATELPGPLRTEVGVLLHNGWKITPAGANQEELGDLLLGGVVAPGGPWLAFVNGGAADHQVHLADTVTGRILVSAPVERAQSSGGIAFSPNGSKLYISGGNSGRIYVFRVGVDAYRRARPTLAALDPLVIPHLQSALTPKADPGKDAGRDPARQDATEEKAYLGGLALSPDGSRITVANLAGNALYQLDTESGKVLAECRLRDFDRPGAVTASPDGQTLYVALWGHAAVLALDSTTLKPRTTLTVGSHPNALLDVPAKAPKPGSNPIPSRPGRNRPSNMCSTSSRRTALTIKCWAT